MTLTRLNLERFTAFEKLRLDLSPSVNVFVGANGTGKTHVMKVAYAACDITKSDIGFVDKLIRVFRPSDRAPGRLVKRSGQSSRCAVEVFRGNRKLRASFSNHASISESATVTGAKAWRQEPLETVYIPVKEMLANAPGFRSLYSQREVHFEEIYADIVDRALLPVRRGPTDQPRKDLLKMLQGTIDGKVQQKNEEFFLRNKQGNLEFTLLAEGLRKLGLLWLLIQNGTLLEGSVLFWDEPETNLNPSLFTRLIEILLELARGGVQVLLATHDYVILKELDLQKKDGDEIAFHSLYRDTESSELVCNTANSYSGIHPNAIADAFATVYDREVKRSLEGLKE
jgi:ABC-type branched-subunit amino acid transport system ATPase component